MGLPYLTRQETRKNISTCATLFSHLILLLPQSELVKVQTMNFLMKPSLKFLVPDVLLSSVLKHSHWMVFP
jgi:hypothetical protein